MNKNKLKSFWRHNKNQPGMWCCLLLLVSAATPPYNLFAAGLFIVIMLHWFIIWRRDRTIDSYRRTFTLISHDADKTRKAVKTHMVRKEVALDAFEAYSKWEHGTEPDREVLSVMMRYGIVDVEAAARIRDFEKE